MKSYEKAIDSRQLRKDLQASHFDLGFEQGMAKSTNTEHFPAPQLSKDTQQKLIADTLQQKERLSRPNFALGTDYIHQNMHNVQSSAQAMQVPL
jgi:hypothetical protein